MKKIIAAFLAGALIMVSSQAIADTVSRVGKKVVSEAEVTLNGTQLSDAIIVDGKSYAPVRDIAEAYGSDVTYKSRKGDKALIELKQNSKFPSSEEMKAQYELEQKKLELSQEKSNVERKLTDAKRAVEYIETETIPTIESNIKKATNPSYDVLNQWKATLEEKKQEVIDLEKQISDIDKRLAELETTK